MRDVQDHYFHLAKQEGYLSRAAYKLIEIDERRHILRKGDRVLDCGAAPGSWMQVAADRVGPKGLVVGIDLQPIKHRFGPQPSAAPIHVIQGDFTQTAADELLAPVGDSRRLFDVVLSDMAPKTTGDPFSDHHHSVRLCQLLLDHVPALLKIGGNLVMKVFEGEAYRDLLLRTESMFEVARGYKPKASRSESTEMYIVAIGLKKIDASADQAPPAPMRRPSTGW